MIPDFDRMERERKEAIDRAFARQDAQTARLLKATASCFTGPSLPRLNPIEAAILMERDLADTEAV